MTQIKIKKARVFPSGEQFFPITHTKAVIDDNGYTAESRLQAMQDEINAKQMEVGAVPSDLTPTESSSNWVTSGGVYNAIQGVQTELTELAGKVFGETSLIELPNGVSSESIGQYSAQNTSGTIWVDERAVIYPGQIVKSLAIQVNAVRDSARLNVYIVDTDFTNPILVASYSTLSSGKNEFFNVPVNVDRPVYVGYEAVNFTFFFLSITPTEDEKTLHKVSTSGENLGVSYSLSSYYLTVENKEK